MKSLLLTLLLMMMGCTTEPKVIGDPNYPTRHTYNLPAKQMVEKVRGVVASDIGLKVESEDQGVLLTSWEPHQGQKFGVAGINRTWQERTRYTIRISPAWDDPTAKSTLEVSEQTQQRPHDKYQWDTQEPAHRPDRAAEMARKIDSALQSSGAAPR